MAFTFGASLIWGTSFVAIGIGLQYSNPYTLLFERFLIATAAILALGLFMKSARVWPELLKARTWILGAVYAASFLVQFLGQDISGASVSALLSNLFVIFVPVAAYFLLRERIPDSSKAAIALSVLGIVLVLPEGLRFTSGTAGDLLLVGSALGYTFFIVLGKRLDISSLASSLAIIVSMTTLMVPVVLATGGPFLWGAATPLLAWESAVWLALPCTVVALAMYTKGLASIGATQSAMLLLFEVIVGVALSVSLLGDSLNAIQLLGAAVITLAILLTSLR